MNSNNVFLDISVVAARKALLKLMDVIKHLLLSAFYTIYTSIKSPSIYGVVLVYMV